MNLLLELLGQEHRELVAVASERERRRGWQGVDAELIGELYEKRAGLIRELDLDINDTTAEEFYHALRAKWRRGMREDAEAAKKVWRKYRYLGCLVDGELVSANVKDVEANCGRHFMERSCECFRQELAKEVKKRYGLE